MAHVRAFTTISTKDSQVSHNNRKTMLRTCNVNYADKRSSTISFRALTFESDHQTSAGSDALGVEAVPSDFVGTSKPSEAIERVMKKRKNTHENSLEEMRKEMAAVHKECESEIWEWCTRIKIQIDNIIATINEARDSIQEADLLRLSDKSLHSIWDSVRYLIVEEKKSVDEFHKCLRNIEHSRRLQIKRVMQKYYKLFHKMSYISSSEIQVLLEHQIQDYNKTVLMNFKVYEKLHLNMNIQADNWKKELKHWLGDIKKRRCDAIASEYFEQLMQKREKLEQTEKLFLYNPMGRFALKQLSIKLSEIEEAIGNCESTIDIFNEVSVDNCTKQLHELGTELIISSTDLVKSYESALQRMFGEYEKEVEIFKVSNQNSFWDEGIERLDETVQSLRDYYTSLTAEFKDLWNQQLKTIQDSLEGICNFLREVNSIWKKQTSRLVELQEKTSQSVDDLTAKHEKSITELEKKVTTLSDQLREATNEEKMQQQLTSMFLTMDLICEKYKFAYDEECKAIEKYLENVFNEVPKMIEQYKNFIGYWDQNIIENSENMLKCGPGFVRQQLQVCRNLGLRVFYWKTTLLEQIMAFCKTFSEATQEAAQEWQKTILSQRYSILKTKLDADSQRREDIKISIYAVRVENIKSHSKKLEDHKEEVNQVLKDTSNRLDEFLQEQKQSFQKYEGDIGLASEKISSQRTTTALQRLQKEIEKIRKDYDAKVQKKINILKEELDGSLESLLKRNDNFLSEIKLFKEGGNFSVEEAKLYRQSLTLHSKTISKSKTTNVQKVDKAFQELTKAIEKNYKTIVERIIATMRELKFYEDAQKILTKCAVILERQACRLLENNTQFMNAAIDNIEESTKELHTISNIGTFLEKCMKIFDSLDSRLNNLMIGFPIAEYHIANDQTNASDNISKGNQRKREKSIQKETNYRNLFMGSAENPPSEDHFAIRAMNTMLKTIDEIQNKAMAFFSPTPKRRETEANYHDYMQQILHQLYCYREQLESLWRQEVQEMLAAAEAFQQSTSACVVHNLNHFHEIRINEMTSAREMKLGELKKAIRIYSKQRNKTYESLKGSHGHPERQESLAKLTEEVMEEENETQKKITNKLTEYKTEIEDLLNSYETSMQNEAESLRKMLTNLEDSGKRQQLQTLLDERHGLPKFTKTSYRLDLVEQANRRSITYRNTLKPAECDSFDIESLVNQFIENAREVYASTVKQWEIETNRFVEAGEAFKQNWRRNVEIVAEVYQAIL